MIRIGEFMAEYEHQLGAVVREDAAKPLGTREYYYGVSYVPAIAERVKEAIQRGSFSKDGEAFKRTCKALGIKHTYKAIYAWLNNV